MGIERSRGGGERVALVESEWSRKLKKVGAEKLLDLFRMTWKEDVFIFAFTATVSQPMIPALSKSRRRPPSRAPRGSTPL